MIIAAMLLLFLLLCAAGCVYPYVGYPWLLSRHARRRSLIVRAKDIQPTVSVIIPAYNRESTIATKVRNTLSQNYAADRIEVLVVDDGSTDRTVEMVNRVVDPRVRLVSLTRSGKLVALQQGARRARGEILVFTDANVSLDPNALRQLVRSFADATVGGVCGAKKVRRSRRGDATGLGEALFARYENWVRRLESRIGSVHAADASLYAVRRSLFVPPRNLAQADDIAISARVVLAHKRFVYEPHAICRQESPVDGGREFRRKICVANYTLRSLLDLKWRLLRDRLYGYELISHTIARCLVPLFVLGCLASSVALSIIHPVFFPLIVAEVAACGVGFVGWLLRASALGRLPFLALPCYFFLLNLAGLFGLVAVLRGYRPQGARPRSLPGPLSPAAALGHTGKS